MPSQFNVKSIVACVELGESRIFKSVVVSQMNSNPTLSTYRLTWIEVDILYMMPELLTVANHDTMFYLSCDCGVFSY